MKNLSFLLLFYSLLCFPSLLKAHEITSDSNKVNSQNTPSGEESTPDTAKHSSHSMEEQLEAKAKAAQENIKAIQETESKSKELLNELNALLNQNVKTYLGEFKLVTNDNVPIKSNSKNNYTFKSISFKIQYGAINSVLLKTSDDSGKVSVFYNSYPIEVKKLWKWNPEHPALRIWNKKGDHLYITNIINFIPSGESGTIHQKNITLTKTDTISKVYTKETIQSMIDFRIYSDALSLFGESPNGLVQFEASSEFFVNTGRLRAVQFMRSIEPFLNIIKYDEKNASVQALRPDSLSYIIEDPMALHQRSFFKIGSKFNLFSYQGRSFEKFSFDLYAKGIFNYAKVNGTYQDVQNEIYYKYLTGALGVRMGVKRIKRYGVNFGFDAIQNWGIPTEHVNDIKQFGIFQYHQEVYLFTDNEKNSQDYKSDAVFLRFNYFDNLNKASGDYFQFEIGFKKKVTF